jgi:hypothetical protein
MTELQKDHTSAMVRKLFSAFLSADRKTLEGPLCDDFTFNSPKDDHINKATYFERCLPGSAQFRSQQIEQLFVQGNQAFIRYLAELKDGTKFRNTEYIRIEGDQIKEVDVYFGATLNLK